VSAEYTNDGRDNAKNVYCSQKRWNGFTGISFLKGKSTLSIPANKKVTLLIDQTFLTTAYPELIVSGGNESQIKLTYSEALFRNGNKGNRNEIDGRSIAGYVDNVTHAFPSKTGDVFMKLLALFIGLSRADQSFFRQSFADDLQVMTGFCVRGIYQ